MRVLKLRVTILSKWARMPVPKAACWIAQGTVGEVAGELRVAFRRSIGTRRVARIREPGGIRCSALAASHTYSQLDSVKPWDDIPRGRPWR